MQSAQKCMVSLILLFALATTKTRNVEARKESDIKSRFLNMFTLVRFPNNPCANSEGICYTQEECRSKEGMANATCASGFGVCCIFRLSCGSTGFENCTRFVSPEDDNGTEVPDGDCRMDFCTGSDVCQIRLDFERMEIAGPFSDFDADSARPQHSMVSRCLFDYFSITAPGNKGPPIICGTNNGYHMYVDSCTDCNILNVFVSSETAFDRVWDVKITQIGCGSPSRAPDGCLQYFTGSTGTLETFNEGGTSTHLASQDYTVCIRPERNFCSICYWGEVFEISNAFDSVGGMSEYDERCGTDVILVPKDVANPLQNEGLQDYITIPGGTCVPGTTGGVIDRYCGEILACSTDTDNSGSQLAATSSVCTSFKPFEIRVFTDEFEEQTNEDGTSVGDPPQVGFRIHYVQQQC